MESLDFVLLFSVVVVAWVGRIAHVYGSVPLVRQNWVWLGREQTSTGMSLGALCSVRISVTTKRSHVIRLRGDRRIDSGRGRPPLYLN